MSGKLYGVGVGPGDPKLMTYLAVETIKNCPVIAVPADGKEHAISYKIASGIVKDMDQKECLGLSSPMTKDRKILEKNYQKVSEEIESTKRFIKSLEKRLEIIDYAYEEFSKSYDDIRENLKELCENDDFLASMICKDIVKRQNY